MCGSGNVPVARLLEEAISLADKFEAKGLKGQALLELGRLYKGKKRIEDARNCFSKAIEVFVLC